MWTYADTEKHSPTGCHFLCRSRPMLTLIPLRLVRVYLRTSLSSSG
jgi:hypothetical protein